MITDEQIREEAKRHIFLQYDEKGIRFSYSYNEMTESFHSGYKLASGKHQSEIKSSCSTCEVVAIKNEKLQAENAKLRECVKFYSVNGLGNVTVGTKIDTKLMHQFYISGEHARQVLKKLQELLND